MRNDLSVPFENYIGVEDFEEAIGQINFNTSGYSSSIFTNNYQNASIFLREIKTDNISVNSSPLVEGIIDIDINLFLIRKNMFYPSPLADGTENNKFKFPTMRAILEKNREKEIQKENCEQLRKKLKTQLEQKDLEIKDLKRQLSESQNLANKYINVFKKSFFSRLFSGLSKKDIENDNKLIS